MSGAPMVLAIRLLLTERRWLYMSTLEGWQMRIAFETQMPWLRQTLVTHGTDSLKPSGIGLQFSIAITQ